MKKSSIISFSKKAIEEMKKSGICAFGEISSTGNDLKYLKHSPLKVVYYNEIIGSSPAAVDVLFHDFLLRLEESKKYKNEKDVIVELAEQWHDVGHLENYFSTKQFLLKARYFNSLEFDDLAKIVTKKSKNKEKLINEINWYKKIRRN